MMPLKVAQNSKYLAFFLSAAEGGSFILSTSPVAPFTNGSLKVYTPTKIFLASLAKVQARAATLAQWMRCSNNAALVAKSPPLERLRGF